MTINFKEYDFLRFFSNDMIFIKRPQFIFQIFHFPFPHDTMIKMRTLRIKSLRGEAGNLTCVDKGNT